MRVFNIKIKLSFLNHKAFKYVVALVITLSIPISIFFAHRYLNQDKIAQGVEVAGIDLSRLNTSQAESKLKDNIKIPSNINLVIDSQSFQIPTQEVGLKYNFQKSADNALAVDNQNIFEELIAKISQSRLVNLPLVYSIDEKMLNQYTSVIAGQASVKPLYPKISLEKSKVSVSRGAPGKDITSDDLNSLVENALKNANFATITTSTKYIDPTLTDAQIKSAETRGEALATKSATIKSADQSYTLDKDNLLKLANPKGGYYDSEISSAVGTIDSIFDREPVNAVFNFKGGRVTEFAAAKTGVKVKNDEFKKSLLSTLADLENSGETASTIDLPADITQPKITTQSVNNLGIKELIGKGESNFHHSIASRVHNVALAASKFNGVLIPPGEVFSFNDTLGDVSAYTGYKQAYVIMDGKTVLGDGGGVCQVSTTMFRAALNAGLQIVERHAHAYRVSYYEEGYPVGLDATVYSPTTDFKFKNDTPGYILVQTITDTKNMHLTFEFYGTSDGRVATLTKPVITSITPPPDDLYTDDPTLPAGKIEQIDWKAWGAKVYFKYKVTRNGEVLENKTFYSNYQPWQAKFLRGVGSTSS